MITNYRTCTYIYDTGSICSSAAVKNQNYCSFHFHHRARLMRMAKYRARNQRFNLQLPPLENMFAVQSALNQLAEAAAADMIDIKRARFLLSVVRAAGHFLMRADKWQASPYYSEESAAGVDLAAQYDLPNDLDLSRSPDEAFPAPGVATDNRQPTTENPSDPRPLPVDNYPNLPPMPTVAWCTHGPGCPEHTIRPDFPVTPENAELEEITLTLGGDAAVVRSKQMGRNWERRKVTAHRQRYVRLAMQRNMRIAADRLAEQKLAEQREQDQPAAKRPPSSVPTDSQISIQSEEKGVLTPMG